LLACCALGPEIWRLYVIVALLLLRCNGYVMWMSFLSSIVVIMVVIIAVMLRACLAGLVRNTRTTRWR
jgi:hypothetical protein